MNRMLKFGLAAAAVAVIAIVGYQLLPGSNRGVGGPTGTPVPTVTPQPSPTETPQPTPTPTPEGLLEPGSTVTFLEDANGLRVEMTVAAADWYGDAILVKNDESAAPDGLGIIGWAEPLSVYGDPCAWMSTTPDEPAATVDALVAALTAQATREATPATDITVDGYAGKAIELSVPSDANFADCDRGEFRSWTGAGDSARYHQDPGQKDRVWIIDVEGTPVVIDAAFYEGTSAADMAELQAILDSIQIEPAS